MRRFNRDNHMLRATVISLAALFLLAPSCYAKDTVQVAQGAVATIYTSDPSGEQLYRGSGFVVDGSGIVATNFHVVYQKHRDASSPLIVMSGERAYFARIISFDAENDMSLLKINATGLEALTLGIGTTLKRGQPVSVIKPSTSADGETIYGSVSNIYGSHELIELDVLLESGDSGSPVLDENGRAVGIVTFVVVDKDMPDSSKRINFAMPIRHVTRLLEQLKNDGKL